MGEQKPSQEALELAYKIFHSPTKEVVDAKGTQHDVDYAVIYAQLSDGTPITVAAARDLTSPNTVRNINIGVGKEPGNFAQIFANEPARGEGKLGDLLIKNPGVAKELFDSLNTLLSDKDGDTLVTDKEFKQAINKVPSTTFTR